MKEAIFVLVFLFIVQEYEKGALVDAEDDNLFLVQTDDNHPKEHDNLPETEPRIILAGLPLEILCQSISFINQIVNLNFLRDLCKSSIPNETTTSPLSTAEPISSTTQRTTIKPSSEQIISFSAENYIYDLYLTCHHVSGKIKLIEATFGFDNSSCAPFSVTSKFSHDIDGKTSVMLSGLYFPAYCESPEKCINLLHCDGTPFFNGTYTCAPINTPVSTMVAEAFEWSIFTITCPAGTIALDSAVYGSIDGVACPPTSVLGYPAFQGAASGLSSFSLVVSSMLTFDNLCSTNTTNKLSVVYSCQTPEPSTLTSLARPSCVLQMVCPQGEINVTRVILRSDRNSSCSSDATTLFRSLVPPSTTEAYFRNLNYLRSCNYSNVTMIASYTCTDTAVSQFTSVAQDYTQMVLKCPHGKKIQLLNSKYYCATNSSEKVYQNPAGITKRCNGKEGTCYFYVTMWTVLEIPFNSSSTQFSVFNNCYINDSSREYLSLRASMLSITYTCTV